MNKNKFKNLQNWDDFVIEIIGESPERADHFLKTVLEEYEKDPDEAVLMTALHQVAQAKGGFAKLAKETGLSRESLYKTLSPKGNPRFHTLKLILQALGYNIFFKHIKKA